MDDALDYSDDLPGTRVNRCPASYRHLAIVADKEIASEHAQWWEPGAKER